MELELGLSLSNFGVHHKFASLKELDLINYVNCDDNSSTISSQSSVNDGDYYDNNDQEEGNSCMKKRGFDEVESCVVTLPLLLWDKHPNEDDKELKRLCNSSSFTINKNGGDEVVGWPPIKSYRKKHNDAYNQQQGGHHRINFPAVENGGGCGGSRFMFVKVQMEGFFITRKVNLKLYHSYEALTSSLLHLFGKGQHSSDEYKLTYQDKEGDWLLAGDVPWRSFIQSVRRLKMLRRDD